MGQDITLKKVRFSFLKVFKAASIGNDGKNKFSTSILLPKDHPQLDDLRGAIDAAIVEKWPDAKKRPKLKLPLRDADTEDDYKNRPEYAGHYFLNAYSGEEYPPFTVDAKLQPAKASDWNSGDFGNAALSLYAFQTDQNKGVAAGLTGVQFTRKGEPLTGRASVGKLFSVEEVDDGEDY